MNEIKLNIGNKQYTVKVALTDEQHEKGLQGVKKLEEDKGMLFVFDEANKVSFWMKDTEIPLDIIFIDEELTVISVAQGEPLTETPHVEDNVEYVLEVNQNSGIKPGDELDFAPERKIDNKKMLVLNSEGKPQMELEGGERIFSRPNTKTLIKFAKKAVSTGNDNDYKKLGDRLFKFLQVQDNNEPEYVKSKN